MFRGQGALPSAPTRLPTRMMEVIEGRAAAQPELVRNLHGADERVVIQIVNIWEADDLFNEHIYHPEICRMVSQLVGDPVLRVWHDQALIKEPFGNPTAWHLDNPYWSFHSPNAISIWIA